MGSRYGRKKRRAHREEIAELKNQLDTIIGVVRTVSIERESARLARDNAEIELDRAMDRLAGWDKRIKQMLGPYTSAAINDTTFRVSSRDSIRQMPVMPVMSAANFSAGRTVSDQQVYYVERILHLLATLEPEDYTRLRRQMYFRIDTGAGEREAAVYGISEGLWLDLQREIRMTGEPPEAFCRDIAKQVAMMLLHGDQKRKRA